jgi:hypothetical protein
MLLHNGGKMRGSPTANVHVCVGYDHCKLSITLILSFERNPNQLKHNTLSIYKKMDI